MTIPEIDKPVKKITEAAKEAARSESAPAPVRRERAGLFRGLLLVLAVAFSVLTVFVKAMPSFVIDLQITRAIQLVKLPYFGLLMGWISWPGFPPQSPIITLFIVLLIYIFGLHWEAVMALMAAVFSATLNVLIKDLIQRPRPLPAQVKVFASLPSYSFPSGHVMYYICFFGFVGFLAYNLLKPSIKRSLIIAACATLVALVGVSRVYLGEHWASDVIGSYLLGSLTLIAIIQFYLWGKGRNFVHQPVAAVKRSET